VHLQPFVLTHKIGHAVCTPNTNTSGISAYTLTSNTDQVEQHANKFAVNLLLNDDYVAEHDEYVLYRRGVPECMVALRV
jgi:Zn-dependent peptidase ImmA (M78 family)